jgi:hypothetical protein
MDWDWDANTYSVTSSILRLVFSLNESFPNETGTWERIRKRVITRSRRHDEMGLGGYYGSVATVKPRKSQRKIVSEPLIWLHGDERAIANSRGLSIGN